MLVTMTAFVGMRRFWSTLEIPAGFVRNPKEELNVRYVQLEKGSPLSRANANISRVTAARYVMFEQMRSRTMLPKMTVIQPLDIDWRRT
jgi:hypothetical protein